MRSTEDSLLHTAFEAWAVEVGADGDLTSCGMFAPAMWQEHKRWRSPVSELNQLLSRSSIVAQPFWVSDTQTEWAGCSFSRGEWGRGWWGGDEDEDEDEDEDDDDEEEDDGNDDDEEDDDDDDDDDDDNDEDEDEDEVEDEEEEDDDDDDIDVSCPHRVLARLRDQPSSIDDQDLMRRAAHGLSPLGHWHSKWQDNGKRRTCN